MTRAIRHRLAALERHVMAATFPRLHVIEGDPPRIAWAGANGVAIVVLPHNSRDPLPEPAA